MASQRRFSARVGAASAWCGVVACLALFVTPVTAAPGLSRVAAAAREVDLKPPPGMRSRSIGYAWEGRLSRGMQVRQSEYIRYVGEYVGHGRFYGTWELVQLLERAARRVAFRMPGSKLSLGELSGKEGGRIDGHRSHQSGRDVDIGFYTLTDGRPRYTYAFAGIDARGKGLAPNGYLRFDDARNWELIAKLLSDAEARVQYIFVAKHLRDRLLTQAARTGAAPSLLERAKAALVQPAHGHPHKNHFHLRIYCAPADRGICKDQAPYWPWYPGTPPATGLSPAGDP